MRFRPHPHLASFALFATAVAAVASPARAQDNSAAVEALFNEGKRLTAEGKISVACPKFLASYNLEKRLGTLLNLADCYEKNAQLASAWARFVEARTLAQRANQQERADYAAQHATSLEPRLSKLTVVVPNGVPGLEIKRDGAPVDAAVYGVAVPVDAGRHAMQASAPGKKPWTGEVVVGADADRKRFELPALADAPRQDDAAPLPSAERRGLSGRAIAGLVVAGVGVVGLGFGAGFGLAALGKNSDSQKFCGQNGTGTNDCFGDGVGLRSDARAAGNLSTVFFSAGAALVIGGVVVWLTAPSGVKTAAVAPDRIGVAF